MVKSDPRAELLAQVIAAPRASVIATLLGKDGRQVRDFQRKVLGVYVSQGHPLTERAKAYTFARFGDNVSAKDCATAWIAGEDAPTPTA